MPLYEDRKNAGNKLIVPAETKDSVLIGTEKTIRFLGSQIRSKTVTALDGWYGVDWVRIQKDLETELDRAGLPVKFIDFREVFRSADEIRKYKQTFITDDPGFGWVNMDGRLIDIMNPDKITALEEKIAAARKSSAVILIGYGAAIPELADILDLTVYFDKTRQPLLWQMWDGKLIPFASSVPDPNYGWKEYYYCDYYLLHRQKDHILETMDYYVEAIDPDDLKMVPRKAYDQIVSSLAKQPVKEVKIYQPGPWGAYRYKDLFDVPGLECNAWNELAGPELSVLIDIGLDKMLNIPFVAVLQYGDDFVGPYINKTYPGLFPMDVWLDDGYFPKPEPAERISMPIHNHPGTDYVKKHFNEPLGRYETYYIAEAYEGANTWMGYKNAADLEEWERKCYASNNLTPIEDWKEYIANWDSNVGDLYLIPPGTEHGHGGNQMVLEMDTCPSIAGTEYSFFTYDFARPSWDDTTKTMTAKPCRMHLDHSFDNDKFRREDWVRDYLRARPKVVKWTKEYSMDQYATLPEMPFHIERLHFYEHGENDTGGTTMHIVTLTVGERVKIRSLDHPDREAEIDLFQSAVIPACFGRYEYVNLSKGLCTIVQIRWKKA